MKTSKIIFIVLWAVLFHQVAVAQVSATTWTRIQSDNGEFSIEVPEGFFYCFDRDGFQVSEGNRDYPLRDVNIVNSYHDGVLVSFEVYRANAGALEPLAGATLPRGLGLKKVDFRGIPAKEIVTSDDNSYFVSRYFRSKEFIYVVSALSRTRDTAVAKRFFESLRFSPDSKAPAPDVTRLSKLQVTPINIVTRTPDTAARVPSVDKPAPSPGDKELIIASKPRAHYVDAAREKDVQGGIQLRLEFGEHGYIPSIEVLTTLPQGLFRQALFAALRIKFLPAEKNGKAVAVKKRLEYTFTIY